MELVSLTRDEKREVDEVALRLAKHWSDRGQDSLRQSISGLRAEFAAIKILNTIYGATPKIEFNKLYENGGDGGFDFECPKGLTFDVKSTHTTFDYEKLKNSKAQVILGIKIYDKAYHLEGFIPTSRITPKLEFKPFNLIALSFPNTFMGLVRNKTGYDTGLERATGIVNKFTAALSLQEKHPEILKYTGFNEEIKRAS